MAVIHITNVTIESASQKPDQSKKPVELKLPSPQDPLTQASSPIDQSKVKNEPEKDSKAKGYWIKKVLRKILGFVRRSKEEKTMLGNLRERVTETRSITPSHAQEAAIQAIIKAFCDEEVKKLENQNEAEFLKELAELKIKLEVELKRIQELKISVEEQINRKPETSLEGNVNKAYINFTTKLILEHLNKEEQAIRTKARRKARFRRVLTGVAAAVILSAGVWGGYKLYKNNESKNNLRPIVVENFTVLPPKALNSDLSITGARKQHILYTNFSESDSKNFNIQNYFKTLRENCSTDGIKPPLPVANFISIKQAQGKYCLTYSNLKDGWLSGSAIVFESLAELEGYFFKEISPMLWFTGGAPIFLDSDAEEATLGTTAILDAMNLNFYSRISSVKKNYYRTIEDVKLIKPFDPAQISFINGIPKNKKELIAQGFQRNSLKALEKASKEFSEKLAPAKAILKKDSAMKELANGSRDILIMLAHSDGLAIYLGNEKITLEDLRKLKGGGSRKRPRMAYLFSCHTGDLNQSSGMIFKKSIASFSQILISNDLVDSILAPSDEITPEESIQVLDQLTQNNDLPYFRKNTRGKWKQIAMIQ